MVNLQDLRDRKKKILEEKKSVTDKVTDYVKENIDKIKLALELKQKIPLKINHNWLEIVSLSRLSAWIKQAKEILYLEMCKESVLEKKPEVRNTEDLFEALAVYYIIRNKLSLDEIKIDGLYIVECHLDLINGDITYFELDKSRKFISPLDTDKQVHINLFIDKPFILKIGNEDLYYEIFNCKIEETMKYFVEIEEYNEDELYRLLVHRIINGKALKPYISLEEVINENYEGLLIENLDMYLEFLYRKKFSIMKKALLVNLLAIGFPILVGSFDCSYFKNTNVLYLVYWIAGIKHKSN